MTGVTGAVPAAGPGSAPALTTAPQVAPDGGWPHSWRGEWVAALEPVAADRHDVVAPTRGPGRWSFRVRVHLDAVPERAPLRLTADSRYALHVNGTEVGRGPVRSQPRRLTYDTHDVAPHLRVGENTVVVLVTHYARANSSWQPAAANAGLGADAVLVLETDLGAEAGEEDERWLVTGPHWEVRREAAWSQTTSAAGIHGGIPVELLDARALHSGWRSGEGDGWSPVVVRRAVHLGALARSRPPTDPYGALLPRPVPPLAGDVVVPATARVHAPLAADSGSTARDGTPVADDAPVERVLAAWPGVDAGTPVDDPTAVVLDAPAGRPVPVSVDVGRITAGRVRFALDAPAGTVVELLYREAAPSTSDAAIDSVPRVGARYTARGDGDDFLAQEVNGFRHVHALVTAPADGRVVLRDLAVVEQLFPAGRTGRWASSDPELDALHAAGVRTVALNALDSYTDCPTREQRAWVGDGVVHASVHLATAQDWTMALRYVDLAASPRPDGILPMSVVGDMEADGGHTIPDWSLYWVRGVRDLWEHTGDADALARHLPVVRRVLEWFTPYQRDDGVLVDVPEWTLVDWCSVLLTGRSAVLTALWARGLRDLEVLAGALGQRADAAWARQRWEQARAGFEQFWDEGRGTYVDHLPSGSGGDGGGAGDGGGLRRLPASQLAGGAGRRVRARAGRAGRARRRVDLRHRAAGGPLLGGRRRRVHLAKIDEQMRGVQRVDWDAEREVVVAEPFAAHLVHDAYAAAGRPDLVVASCRRWSVFLTDGYDTFGECWGWGTPVHGWSATPTRDLVRSVLGVTPAEPGFAAVRVAPAFGVVERVEGEVPTPHGWVRVVVDGRDVTVDSPVPVVLVDADGVEHRLPATAAAAR